jgi:hypothetical protein
MARPLARIAKTIQPPAPRQIAHPCGAAKGSRKKGQGALPDAKGEARISADRRAHHKAFDPILERLQSIYTQISVDRNAMNNSTLIYQSRLSPHLQKDTVNV